MGIILALIGAVLWSAKDLVSKHLSVSLDPTSSTFASFFFALPFYFVAMLVAWLFGILPLELGGSFFLLVFLRALSDAGAEWSKMKAYSLGDISFVAPILSLSPLFLLIVAPIITGDEVSPLGLIAVLSSVFGGILLCAEKSTSGEHKKEVITFSLTAAFLFSLNASFDRLAVQKGSPLVAGFAMTAIAAMFFLPFVIGSVQKQKAFVVSMKPLLLRGVFETTFMSVKLWSLVYLSPQYAATFSRVSLLFTIVGGKVLYGEKHFGRRMAAAFCIIMGIVLVLFEN